MDVGRQQTSDTGGNVLSAERTKGHYCVDGIGSLGITAESRPR